MAGAFTTIKVVLVKEHDRYLLDNEATRTAIRCMAYYSQTGERHMHVMKRGH